MSRLRHRNVWSLQVELRVSPFLKPLHDDPRWQALLFEPA